MILSKLYGQQYTLYTLCDPSLHALNLDTYGRGIEETLLDPLVGFVSNDG